MKTHPEIEVIITRTAEPMQLAAEASKLLAEHGAPADERREVFDYLAAAASRKDMLTRAGEVFTLRYAE